MPPARHGIGLHVLGDARERYTDSEAALAHLRAFEENWQERLLKLIEPIQTTVWGTPSEELRAELGAGTRFHTTLGGFTR